MDSYRTGSRVPGRIWIHVVIAGIGFVRDLEGFDNRGVLNFSS